MFQLSLQEADSLLLQSARAKAGRGGRQTPPYAFTELGVAMLSSVLNTHPERVGSRRGGALRPAPAHPSVRARLPARIASRTDGGDGSRSCPRHGRRVRELGSVARYRGRIIGMVLER